MAQTKDQAPAAEGTRELLLDVAERLMGERGYAATPVSAICRAADVAVTSLYWHFGSKEGLLATVMERGAARWFAALPRFGDADADPATRTAAIQRAGAAAVGAQPVFLRLFYLLALQGHRDEAVAGLIQRVRRHAIDYFQDAIGAMLASTVPAELANAAARELTPFAVAFSDGCFFATQLEPAEADLERMYGDLVTALLALAPAAVERARQALGTSTEQTR